METINYQGQEIEVNVIREDNTVLGEGTDSLMRDDAGRYYLSRHREPQDGDFYALHRISTTAAILWSIDPCDRFNVVRQDAAGCLMKAAAGESTASSATRQFADGSMAVTLYLKPDPARLFRAACEIDDHDPVTKLYWAVEQDVQGALESGPGPRESAEAIFDANVPEVDGAANPYGVGQDVLEDAIRHAADNGRTLDEFIADALELAAGNERSRTNAKAAKAAKAAKGEEETVTVNLVDEEDGKAWDTLELPRAAFDEIERRAKARGQDFATYFAERVRNVVSQANARELPACLDSEAAALVRRYHEVSPWSYTTADILNGCVVLLLTLAFSNQEEAERITGLDSNGFHDGDWGSAEEAIYDALKRRTGGKSPHIKGAPGEPVEEAETEMVGLPIYGQDQLSEMGRRHVANPADVALLAAAEPEPVEDDQPGVGAVESRPNEEITATVPCDFRAMAVVCGHDPFVLLWQFAENFCARFPMKVEVLKLEAESTAPPAGIIPFPFVQRHHTSEPYDDAAQSDGKEDK